MSSLYGVAQESPRSRLRFRRCDSIVFSQAMPELPDKKQPVKRVDSDGRLQVGPNWETLIERQIRQAMAEGKFDELPHHGEPLPKTDYPYAGDQALAFSILKNNGAAPPWIESDKEARRLMAERDAIVARAAEGSAPSSIARGRDRRALETLVAQINGAIRRLNAEAPSYRVHRQLLNVADELARYDEACRRP
jgi:hypothetical protein